MKNLLSFPLKNDKKIGYAHTINIQKDYHENTKYGQFMAGSPLSFQLAIFDADFDIISNLLRNFTNDPWKIKLKISIYPQI